MAKTLVALYDTFTDAERVVQELMEDGFTRSDIHLALDHTKSREPPPHPSRGTPPMRVPTLLTRLSTWACRLTRRTPMQRGCVEAVHSWWSRAAMNGRNVAWRF